MRIGHTEHHVFTLDLCSVQSRGGSENHAVGCNAVEVSEPCDAPPAVAAHVGLTAIRVVVPHPEVRFCIIHQKQNTVGTYRKPPVADRLHEGSPRFSFGQNAASVIHDDEVVPGADHFCEGQFQGVTFRVSVFHSRGRLCRPATFRMAVDIGKFGQKRHCGQGAGVVLCLVLGTCPDAFS